MYASVCFSASNSLFTGGKSKYLLNNKDASLLIKYPIILITLFTFGELFKADIPFIFANVLFILLSLICGNFATSKLRLGFFSLISINSLEKPK